MAQKNHGDKPSASTELSDLDKNKYAPRLMRLSILLNPSDTSSRKLNATTSLNSALLTLLFNQHSGGDRFFSLDKIEDLPDSPSLSSS